MSLLMLGFMRSYAGVLIGIAVIGCGDEGKPAGEPDGSSDVEVLDVAVEPEVDVEPEADLAVETEADAEAETEADAAAETEADVAAETEAETQADVEADGAVEIDAEADVPVEADVVSGPVTITVIDPDTGVGRAGEAVMFSRVDGSTITTLTTDAAGVARAVVEAGATVSVQILYPSGASRTYTIVDVAPGDALRIGYFAAPTGSSLGAVTATSAGRFPEASYYTFAAPCTSVVTGDPTASPLMLDVPGGCGGNPVDFVMLATTPALDLLAYRLGLDVTVAGPQTLDLGPWVSTVQTVMLTLDNPLDGETQVWAGARSNGHRLLTNFARSPTPQTRRMTIPPGLDAYDYRVSVLRSGAVSTLVRYLPGALVDTSIDVAAELLPIAAVPTLDGRTLVGLGADAALDGVIVKVMAYGDASAEWLIALPPGVTTATLPTLPGTWRDPLALAERFIDAYYYESDFTDGYPAFRAAVHTTEPEDPFGYIDTVPTGVTGRTRVSHTAN